MNKQELIDKLKKQLTAPSEIDATDFNKFYDLAINYAIYLAEQLDEPEKPVVPQFVADWFEDREHNLEFYVSNLCVNFQLHKEQLNDEFADWYSNFENEPIQTLVKMKLYGYEVEKDKLYTVEIPDPNGLGKHVLVKGIKGDVFIGHKCPNDWREVSYYQLTEAEIKQDFDWAWQFAKEVEDDTKI